MALWWTWHQRPRRELLLCPRCVLQSLFLQFPRLVILNAALVMTAVTMAGFFSYHVWLTVTNQTTNERYKREQLSYSTNPYTRGLLANIGEDLFLKPPSVTTRTKKRRWYIAREYYMAAVVYAGKILLSRWINLSIPCTLVPFLYWSLFVRICQTRTEPVSGRSEWQSSTLTARLLRPAIVSDVNVWFGSWSIHWVTCLNSLK